MWPIHRAHFDPRLNTFGQLRESPCPPRELMTRGLLHATASNDTPSRASGLDWFGFCNEAGYNPNERTNPSTTGSNISNKNRGYHGISNIDFGDPVYVFEFLWWHRFRYLACDLGPMVGARLWRCGNFLIPFSFEIIIR